MLFALRPIEFVESPRVSAVRLVFLAACCWGCGLASLARAEDQPPSSPLRPQVVAHLKSGEVLEGRLHRFADGRYTIVAAGRTWHFGEDEAKSISFQKAPPALRANSASRYDTRTTAQLVSAFAHPAADVRDRSYGDARLIPVLASRGAEVIEPLIQEVAKNSSLYQNVGKVFQLLGPEHFPAMLSELQAGTPGAQQPFYWALQQTGVRAAPILRELLTHDDPKIRSFALDTLYNIGIQSGTVLPSSLTPVLIKTLDDPVPDVRQQAPAILAMVGRPLDDIMPPLLAAVPAESETSDLGYHSVLAMESLARRLRATDPWRTKIDITMRECLFHPNDSIRSSAARYFGAFEQPPQESTVQALKQAADDPVEYVRKTARETLYKFDISPNRSTDIARLKKAANSELVQLIAGEDTEAAHNAVQILKARTPSSELLDLLMDVVARDRQSTYWNQVPAILAWWNEQMAVPLLEKYAAAESPKVRRVVAMSYATMGLRRLPNSLSQLAVDPDMGVRSEAIRTLGRLASGAKGAVFEAAVPLLLNHIEDTSIQREYHWGACDALVEAGISHPDVLPTMIGLAKTSPDANLREAMIEALGELGADLRADSTPSRQIVETLAALLDEERTAEMKREVIYALTYMRADSPVAISALKKAQDDPRGSVAKAAAEAIGKLSARQKQGDPGDPPAAPDEASASPR